MSRYTRNALVVAEVFFLFSISNASAAIIEYYNRAAWEAALSGIVVETVNSIPSALALPQTIGTHNFTAVNAGPSFVLVGNVNGSPGLTWSGSGSSIRRTQITIPMSYGVGVDYFASAESNDSEIPARPHNSYYFKTSGNSGNWWGRAPNNYGELVNDYDQFGVGNVPLNGFYGVIDTLGGITSYQVGTVLTNFQSFGADNFSYATSLASVSNAVPEPSTWSLMVFAGAGLGLFMARRSSRAAKKVGRLDGGA